MLKTKRGILTSICLAILLTSLLAFAFLNIGYNFGVEFGSERALGLRTTDISREVIGDMFIGFTDNLAYLTWGDATQVVIAYNSWGLISHISVTATYGALQLDEGGVHQGITLYANHRYIASITYFLPQNAQSGVLHGSDRLVFEFYSSFGSVLFTEAVNITFGMGFL